MRMLFAADFHLRASMDVDALVEQMHAANADLILLGGDYADSPAQAERLFRAFRRLRPTLGILAVPGNNDWEVFGSRRELQQAMDVFDGRLLVNECMPIGKLLIGGIDEYKHGFPEYAPIFRSHQGTRILLSHYPILPMAPPEEQPALMLSGHTHGGQFNLLGVTPYSVGFEHFTSKPALVSGMARFGPTTLLVTKGIGASRIPLRVGVRSELHLLTLTGEPQ